MRLRTRLARPERRGPLGETEGHDPPVEVWLPKNGRDGRPHGRYHGPGSKAILVIYQPEEPAPGEGDS